VLFSLLTTLLPLVNAQQDGFPYPGYHGGPPSSSSSPSGSGSSYNYKDTPSFQKSSRILIAHAVLGTIAWALLAPLASIFLRLDLPGVNLLKVHYLIQITVYAMTIVTTGLGIHAATTASKYSSVWTNSHVIIGFVIFSVASIQPWLGWIHHVIFKRRLIDFKKGIDSKKPGRTILTRLHIWIGRTLILLGVVNGGLGMRLAAGTPFNTPSATLKAEVAYGVLAGLMFLLYAGISIGFECRRAARLRAGRIGRRVSFAAASTGYAAGRRYMLSSPMASEESVEFDEKGSEVGQE
jgi:hypothetical protein